jgi:hypothetical protein
MDKNKENKELKIFYVEYDELKKKPEKEIINYLIDKIEKDYVVIVNSSLDPIIEMELTKEIINKIKENPERFKGIEFVTIKKSVKGFLNKLFNKKKGLTLIGPSHIIRSMEREGNIINVKF